MPNANLVFTGIGVLLVVLSIPLLLRRVPPNPIYGLRVPATFKDDQVWYDANAATGRDVAIVGVIIALSSVVLPVLGVRDMPFQIAWTAITVGGLAIASVA